MPVGDIGVVRENVTFGRSADADIPVVECEALARVRAGHAAEQQWRCH
jgi:hypothetical protein